MCKKKYKNIVMKKIIITQRYERIGNFKELRDNLDARLSETIEKLGFIPILLPNKLYVLLI